MMLHLNKKNLKVVPESWPQEIKKLKPDVTLEMSCYVVLSYVDCLVIFWTMGEQRLLTTIFHYTLPLN